MKRINWEEQLQEDINLLGHRNWIVITDMAYPLQSQVGIKTFFTNQDYKDVLKTTYSIIESSPHVQANIYQDSEIQLLSGADLEGVDDFKKDVSVLLGDKIIYEDHEKLIAKLDEVSKVFNVIILKSNLLIPYTTTFFELDCKYWNAQKQEMLDKRR